MVDLIEVFGRLVSRKQRRDLKKRQTGMWKPMVNVRKPLDRTLNLDVSCFPGEEPNEITIGEEPHEFPDWE